MLLQLHRALQGRNLLVKAEPLILQEYVAGKLDVERTDHMHAKKRLLKYGLRICSIMARQVRFPFPIRTIHPPPRTLTLRRLTI